MISNKSIYAGIISKTKIGQELFSNSIVKDIDRGTKKMVTVITSISNKS